MCSSTIFCKNLKITNVCTLHFIIFYEPEVIIMFVEVFTYDEYNLKQNLIKRQKGFLFQLMLEGIMFICCLEF